ncbi:MAG: hypothetical protein SGJ17_07320 [Hyphomicrobiales bacterium]|nr:hypothetical protein [Hyphomicrobiales bacterium]
MALTASLMTGGGIVHPRASQAQTPAPEILRDVSKLPEETQRMRQAILAAAVSGDIETLRVAADMNELPPVFSNGKVADPVAFWKKLSGDGEGREILAILIEIFRTGYTRKTGGKDGDLFIWPYFAETRLQSLNSGQQVELLTLVSAADAKKMLETGKYTHYRVGISSTGVWHFFDKAE